MNKTRKAFASVVLAADRGPNDPVAAAAGVRCKSLAPVGGRPMIFHVLDALAASQNINTRILCGPPKSILTLEYNLNSLIESGEIKWYENQSTPSASAFNVLRKLSDDTPVILTTADNAMLSPRIVDYFCSEAMVKNCDVAVGIARHEKVTKAYPQTRRTATRLKDDAYCGCNLFAFLTPRSRHAADFWRQVESQRKKPWRMIRILGWTAISRYLLGQLSLDEALERISNRLGFKAGAVVLPFPEAAVDIDSVSDWKLVDSLLSNKEA